MQRLRDLQEQFAGHLQDPANQGVAGQIKSRQLSNLQRLQIYRNNFRISLKNNLAAIYPVIEKLVGESFFNHACQEYITHHPSTQGNLHAYGDQFYHFLQTFEAARPLEYLPDMARFEWAYHEVFHEADGHKLDMSRLQAIDPQDYPDIVFVLHPATRLIASRFPILDIWRANQRQDPPQLTIDKAMRYYLIGRRDKENIFQTLEKHEYDFLKMIESQRNLGDILQHITDAHRLGEAAVNELLISHVATRNIHDFRTG